MAEIIIGAGRQKSIRDVAKIAEDELKSVEGIPRKISGRSDDVDFVVERQEFKGEFDSFTFRVRAGGKTIKALMQIAEEWADVCEHSEEGGYHTFICPPLQSTDYERAREVIDKLSAQVQLPEVWRFRGDNYRLDRISVELLFQGLVQYKASDVHLSPGEPPVFRIDTQIHNSDLMRAVSAVQIRALIREIAPDKDWQEFEENKQCSFGFHQMGLGYARVSAFIKGGSAHLTLRYLPEVIPSFTELAIPAETMVSLANLQRGLVLVTGMTGSGKTTTCAALVDYINSTKMLHILCIENPIEFVHKNKKSIISQRNLGSDVLSFGLGVEGALRHDPDVIVIGEMRDPDTIRSAINAAATGHLVISTLHTNSASEVVNRIVSFFDPVERDLVKLQLRDSLKCVICQRLVPRISGGRVPALELMFNDVKSIADSIISGDTDGIRIGMQQAISASFIFERYLSDLFNQGIIDLEMAREYCSDVSIFDQMHMGTYSIPRVESMIAGH